MSLQAMTKQRDSSQQWKLAALREMQQLFSLAEAKKISGNVIINVNFTTGIATDARSSLNKNLVTE